MTITTTVRCRCCGSCWSPSARWQAVQHWQPYWTGSTDDHSTTADSRTIHHTSTRTRTAAARRATDGDRGPIPRCRHLERSTAGKPAHQIPCAVLRGTAWHYPPDESAVTLGFRRAVRIRTGLDREHRERILRWAAVHDPDMARRGRWTVRTTRRPRDARTADNHRVHAGPIELAALRMTQPAPRFTRRGELLVCHCDHPQLSPRCHGMCDLCGRKVVTFAHPSVADRYRDAFPHLWKRAIRQGLRPRTPRGRKRAA